MKSSHFKVLIVGGGSGGISVAARLSRMGFSGQMGLIEPSETHFYQPLWTLAGVGLVDKSTTKKAERKQIPPGVTWIKDRVITLSPDTQSVQTGQQTISYDILVLASGLELNFDEIEGLKGHLGTKGLMSIYRYDMLDATAQMVRDFKGGRAIFTIPPIPIKCAGAPQKVMYLADDIWRKKGVENRSLVFASAGASIFGIKEFAAPLTEVIRRRKIECLFQHKLIAVKPDEKSAMFAVTTREGVTHQEVAYDLLHVVPPMSAHAFVRDSTLASEEPSQKGWLAVDKFSLQHSKYPNVFGIGDVTGIPNSKTGAAIRKQAPIVAENVRLFSVGKPVLPAYDGYSSCPLITGIGSVILAEFGYDGKLLPTFPGNPTKERRAFWYLKKDVLPKLYWNFMLKGML